MELDDLRALSPTDQQTFLIGRIGMETVRMDIALRFLNGVLRGHRTFDAFMVAPEGFKANAAECDLMIDRRVDTSERERRALHSAIDAARQIYSHRNRYVHRFLRTGLLRKEQWELAHLSRPKGDAPEVENVSFDEMVEVVCDIVGVTYRLRSAAMYVASGTWSDSLFGHVEGAWDGSAEWVGPDDDAEGLPTGPHHAPASGGD
ncbi:hypothetical protein ACFY9N_03885 [Microbacterium sp. NPDC008134]|uniref:hypothetical protein n=1 Tax=Microbacterium sp. NPDC008134 TaxID=3364183 RepID=UPI0036F116B4